MAEIGALLGADEQTAAWLAHLDEIGEPDLELTLPSAADLPAVLLDLAVPHEEIDDLIALLPAVRTAEIAWLLRRCGHSLVRAMGAVQEPPSTPRLPADLGALARYFYLYVFVAVLPHVRAFHRSRQIPDDVSRLTLSDTGRKMAVHRRRHGVGGIDAPWLTRHFRGTIYQLGRLQFELATLDERTGEAIRATGAPYGPGSPVLSVHIPEFCGPLSPEACDDALRRAREFFPRHFPEERYDLAYCQSWLLDEQLARFLPETSNLVRFQRRFQPLYRPDTEDHTVLEFVFGRVPPDLADLPRRTSLQRAVADHLAAGGRWYGGVGWLPL